MSKETDMMSSSEQRPALNAAVIPFVILMGLVASLALPATYTDPTVFAHGWRGIFANIFGNIGIHGTAVTAFMCIALIGWTAVSLPKFLSLDITARVVAAVVGSFISLSIVLTPYGLGPAGTFTADHSAPMQASDIGYVPQTVAPADATVQYYLYLILRWVAIVPICTVTVAFVLWLAVRAILPDTLSEMMGTVLVFSDDFLLTVRSAGTRFWHALWFGETLFARLSPSRCAINTVVMLVPWSVWLWLMKPANIAADTVAQITWYRTGNAWDPALRQFLPGYAMSDHHPWLETLLYGAFDKFGVSIGNEALGLRLLALLQAMLLAVAFSIMLGYMGGYLGLSWKWCMAALLFLTFNPVFGRLPATVVKDITAMPFIIVWSVLFIEYVRRIRARQKVGVDLVCLLIVFSLLCAETRKISIYVILVVLLLVLTFFRKRLLTLLIIVASIGSMSTVNSVAFSALDIAKGGKQEMLAIPLQQTFSVLYKYGDSMNPRHKHVIESIIVCEPQQIIDTGYDWTNANPVKDRGCYNKDATTKDLIAFMMVWMQEGLAHPRTYIESVSWLGDYFKFGPVYDEGFYVRVGWEEYGTDKLILPEYASNAELPRGQKLAKTIYTAVSKTPVLGLLMSEATYTVCVPLLCIGLCVVLRRWENLIYASPMLISICTLLVTPRHNTRYSYTLLFCSILLLAIPFIKTVDRKQ